MPTHSGDVCPCGAGQQLLHQRAACQAEGMWRQLKLAMDLDSRALERNAQEGLPAPPRTDCQIHTRQLRSFQWTWCDWLAQCYTSCPILLLAPLRVAVALCLCKHNTSQAVHSRQTQVGNKAGHDSTYGASPANDNRTEPWIGLCLAGSRFGRSDNRVGILGHITHRPAALFSVLRRALQL